MQAIKRPGNGDGNASSRPTADQAAAENDDVSSDEDEVLEESPCGRWQKRKDEVCIPSNALLVCSKKIIVYFVYKSILSVVSGVVFTLRVTNGAF